MAIRAELNRLSSLRTRMMHGLQSWPTSLWVNEICLQIITKFTNHELCEEQIYGNPNSWDHRMIIHKNKHVEPPVLAAHLAKPSFHVTTITMAHGPKCSGFRAMSHLQRRYMVAYLLVHVKLTTPTDGSVSSRKAFWWFHFVDGIEWDKSPTAWPKWLDWSVQLECDDTRPSFVLGFPMCEQSDGSHGLYKSISDLRRTYIFDWQDLRVLHLSISLRIRIYIFTIQVTAWLKMQSQNYHKELFLFFVTYYALLVDCSLSQFNFFSCLWRLQRKQEAPVVRHGTSLPSGPLPMILRCKDHLQIFRHSETSVVPSISSILSLLPYRAVAVQWAC